MWGQSKSAGWKMPLRMPKIKRKPLVIRTSIFVELWLPPRMSLIDKTTIRLRLNTDWETFIVTGSRFDDKPSHFFCFEHYSMSGFGACVKRRPTAMRVSSGG